VARPKPDVSGKRVNVYIPPGLLEMHGLIENFSAFVQIALEQAPDIMAFAILHEKDPKKYHYRRTIDEVIDQFNEQYPQDELTQKRNGTWPKNSQPTQELW